VLWNLDPLKPAVRRDRPIGLIAGSGARRRVMSTYVANVGITNGRLNPGGTGQGTGEGDWLISSDARADLTVVRAERKAGAVF
jgi:hypothetical protein